jgi:nucleoside-diphosphate-sugar epimerase
VYVGDVVRANFLAAECATADGRAMNVGTTRAVTVNGLLQTLCDITGHRVPVTYAPPRSGDIRASWASVDRARELLGFEARVPFDEGLRQTVGTC